MHMNQTENGEKYKNAHLKTVDEMIQNIQYGSVTIIVQDGKVVQIEKLEKHRIKNGPVNRRFCTA